MSHKINEELKYMKYLLGYQKGKVISEQDYKFVGDDESIKKSGFEKPSSSLSSELPPGPKNTNMGDVTTPSQSSQTNVSQNTVTQPSKVDLEQIKQQLESQLNSVEKNLEMMDKKLDFDQKQIMIKELTDSLQGINQYLNEKCVGLHLFRGCRSYKKEKERINRDIRVLMGLIPPSTDTKKFNADNVTKWTAVGSALVTLLGGIIRGFLAFKAGKTGDTNTGQ